MNLFKQITLLSLFISLHSFVVAQSNNSFFTLDPTLSPDGKVIVFSYDGDLWKVPTAGGNADRLTAMDGNETRPAISPDGQWLAFSSTQMGNKDIYIMPMAGGEIQQLTFHQSNDDVDAWSWDSQTIYFTSDRDNRYAGFSISRKGDTPRRLFNHYFNTVHNIVPHPVSGEIFFNESWESKNFAHRKRYKGAYNPNIKSYHPKSGVYKTYTDYIGKDFGLTIAKDGTMYFMSDEANGEYNLYTFRGEKKKRLTKFSHSIYWPKVSANGQKVVFRKDYQIFIYDVKSGKTLQPKIRLFKNQTLDQAENYQIAGKISNFNVSSDNKKMVFVSRGRLFISDIKGKFVKELKTTPNEAVSEVMWMKDNKTILYSQSINGYYNWYTIGADGSSPQKQITSDEQTNRNITFNSDKSKAVYLSGSHEVRIMDLETMKSETIVEEELWATYNFDPSFSPDDKYVMFSAYRNFEQDIFVYNLENKKLLNLSQSGVSEDNPTWSPDGKYIYFASNRLKPSYPYGTRDAKIYRMPLDNYEAPFKSDKIEELFKEEEKKDKEGKKKAEKKDEEKSEETKKDSAWVHINPNAPMDRLERISPSFGSQSNAYVLQKDKKTIVLYISDHDEGTPYLWKTTIEPFEKNKTEKLSKEKMYGFGISKAKDSYYVLAGGNIFTLDAAGGKMKKIELSHTFRKNKKDEFRQMFYEAWAGMQENYYSEDFHGQDWNALRDWYATFLPFITTRGQLRLLFNDMLGELNSSHQGFYSNGKEEKTYFGNQSIATGILFEKNNPYTVERIIHRSPADVKGKDIKKGDILTAVNGIAIAPHKNREMYFSAPSIDKEITLTFRRNGVSKTVKLHTTNYRNIKKLRYDEWEDNNRAYVDQKTDKKVAYAHMKNMGEGELNRFMIDIIEKSEGKEALILDLRYNTGGNVHDELLNFLSQRTYLQWKYRDGKLTPQSNFGLSDKPIVLLVNEQTLSDAEMTAAGFKALKLGPIIGTETYRWIIFTGGKGLVDGSFYRLPSWGCYTLDGKDLEKEGVSPDIQVDKNFKDRLDNNHPQLDKAIEVIKDMWK